MRSASSSWPMRPRPGVLHLGAGVLIGFGLSGCSFNLVLGAFGKLLPEKWRPMAFGAGTAAGSFGQFLFPPIGNVLIDAVRLASGARRLRRERAARPAARRSPSRRGPSRRPTLRRARARPEPVDPPGPDRGVPAPLLRAARARLLHLRLPARLHHRAPAGLSQGCGPLGRHRRLDACGDRPCQCLRLARLGLALHPHVEALAARLDLSRPLGGDRRLHPAAGLARRPRSCSASPSACSGSPPCRPHPPS